ncbi:MAG: rRNA maturation RNase YbeY [Burkholderiales bacterium]|nr:rRNA maturation RNase YbeY [Burkholderiales bacterium]
MAQEEVKSAQAVLAIQRASRASHIPGDARLRAWARAALSKPAVVTLRYVAATEGRRLNREFRGKDYATNVLTFIYGRDPAGALSGDVVICAPVVAREAREQGKEIDAHHAHLLVHGLLHLQGHDHERRAEAARMERLEREILARLGFPDPYAGG